MDAPSGGGGALSLEKGTDCGLTDAEMWLSRANIANRSVGCPVIINAHKELSNLSNLSNNKR